MNLPRLLAYAFLCLLGLGLNAHAATPQAHEHRWTGSGQLGLVLARGNVDTDTGNAKLNITEHAGLWKHELTVAGLYGKNAGLLAAERLESLFQSSYSFGQAFAFGDLHDLIDKFSGFEYQASATAGLGYNFLTARRLRLSAQVGYGYLRQRPQKLLKTATGIVIGRTLKAVQASGVATAAINLQASLFRTSKLIEKLSTLYGAGNTSIEDDTELQVKMSTRLAVGLGLTVHYNSSPPHGALRTDTITTANLVYSF